MNPENSSDYRELLVLRQEQRILEKEIEEMFSQLEGIRRESNLVFLGGITFGLTAFSLSPFTVSSLLVFMGRTKLAGLVTGIGLTVVIMVLSMFQYYYLGEQIQIKDEVISIRQDIEDKFRQSDNIRNQTEDILSRMAARG
jgi:hypothetical protein